MKLGENMHNFYILFILFLLIGSFKSVDIAHANFWDTIEQTVDGTEEDLNRNVLDQSKEEIGHDEVRESATPPSPTDGLDAQRRQDVKDIQNSQKDINRYTKEHTINDAKAKQATNDAKTAQKEFDSAKAKADVAYERSNKDKLAVENAKDKVREAARDLERSKSRSRQAHKLANRLNTDSKVSQTSKEKVCKIAEAADSDLVAKTKKL